MRRKYIAFISYRHMPRDMAIAKQVHRLIENYIIPKDLRKRNTKKLGIVFRDQEELSASSDLSADIQTALDNAEYLIVICSRGSAASVWVQKEIQYFLQTPHRKRVLAILADGEPAESFPAVLTQVYDEPSGTVRETEPLAVDVRSGSTYGARCKLRKEYKRLVAALLECPYDALVLREQRRMLTRIVATSVAAVMVVSGFLGMLWSKNRQIAQKNDALALEKANVQYRESQLLTADAQESLIAGDYRSAIQYAADALSLERPYYAPAEKALLEAMNVFGEKQSGDLLYDTVLEQMTPVADFCISDDGKRVVTLDDYGQLHCFDATDGSILWSGYTHRSDNALADDTKRIIICPEKGRTACLFLGQLTCYDLDTGSRLWERDIGEAINRYIFYNAAQDAFLYADAEYDMMLNITGIDLKVISGSSGELLQTIPFVQEENLSRCGFPENMGVVFSVGGVFSKDGTTFASAYIEWSEDYKKGTLICYTVDLSLGTARISHQQALECPIAITNVGFADQEKALVVTVLESENDLTMSSDHATVIKLDLTKGSVLWERKTPSPEEQTYLRPDNVVTEIWPLTAFIACGDWLYCLDAETGNLVDSAQLSAEVVWLDTTGDATIGFFLKNGEYGVAWKNSEGINTATTSIGAFRTVKNYGGGVLQFYSDAQAGEYEIAVSNRVREGYAAVIPADDIYKVLIKRLPEKIQCVQEQNAALPLEDIDAYDAATVFGNEDKMILGPLHNGETDHYVTVDLKTFSATRTYDVEKKDFDYSIFFTPDGGQYILHTPQGAVFVGVDGTEIQVATEETHITGSDGKRYYIYNQICCDGAYLTDTNDVITARLGVDQLRIWKNGEEIGCVSLPENQMLVPGNACSRFVNVYPNGNILVSDHIDARLSDLAVYNIYTETWDVLPCAVALPNENALALSENQTRLAYADDQDLLWVVDYGTGKTGTSFPLQMPYHAVVDMQFSLGDSVLIVMTKDGQVWIYDIAEGAVVFRDVLHGNQDAKLQVFQDEKNQRLYAVDRARSGSPNGICIDLRTWTTLAKINDMLFFDQTEGVLYQCRSDHAITCRYIPSLEELLEMANQFLQTG